MLEPGQFGCFFTVDGNPVRLPIIIFRTLTREKDQQVVFFLQRCNILIQKCEDIDEGRFFFCFIGKQLDLGFFEVVFLGQDFGDDFRISHRTL